MTKKDQTAEFDQQKLIQGLVSRLDALEAERSIRACMIRYMAICDELDVNTDLNELMALFTEDAEWKGAGSRYAKTFGKYSGHEEIETMFSKYTVDPAHFQFNAHFMCNELIEVTGKSASGRWMLIQPSTFASGESRLSCAKISAQFECQTSDWKIKRFVTENLFSRPMKEPWDSESALDVPK